MTSEVSLNRKSGTLDRVGVVASSMCALHCLVCALAPSALAMLGLGALIGHEVEWGFTVLAAVTGILAGIVGFRMHRSWTVPSVLTAGVLGLVAARFMEEWGLGWAGIGVGTAAGLALVVGHVLNTRACHNWCPR